MKKKGFTLIELLAVIVILAIIALIATPVILGIINNVKDESNKRSIELYAEAVEQAIARRNLTEEFNPSTCIIVSEGLDCYEYEEKLKVDIDGEKTTGGTIYFENGSVKEESYFIKGNKISILNDDNKITTEIIPEPESFKTDSWKTISLNVKAGNLSKYNVGDTREISLKGFTNEETDENGNNIGTYTIRIANKTNTGDVCTKENLEKEDGTKETYSKTACGFVIEFEDIIKSHQMNPSGEYKGNQYDQGWNVDGYPASSMYTYIKNDIYNALPKDLRDVIIDTTVVSGYGYSDAPNKVSTDKLYLLSTREVWGKERSDLIYPDTARELTRQLDYYKDYKNTDGSIGVTISNYSGAIKKFSVNEYSWWLRTAGSGSTHSFHYVRYDGDWDSHYSSNFFGVAVAFRIG